MDSGRVVTDGVFPGEEDSWRVLDHIVVLAGVPGDHRRGQDVVVVAGGAGRNKGIGS